MAKAITMRLDEVDHAALEEQAAQLRVRPGTLARILVHAGLSGGPATSALSGSRAALDRLVQRSAQQPAADAVTLVAEARVVRRRHATDSTYVCFGPASRHDSVDP